MPPRDPQLGHWETLAGDGDPTVDDEEVTFPRGRDGNSGDNHLDPLAPLNLDKDAGHLINPLSTRLQLGILRINTFSGKAMLGKMEVSFEQWYHEVQCVKDHYPEPVFWESIVRLLKGAAADMAQYMGPTASMAHISHILQMLTIIFGTMVSSDVLMQNFYKVTQGNHKKVSSFTTRLEGSLSQIRLQCPRRVTDLEVQQHLKHCSSMGSASTSEIP